MKAAPTEKLKSFEQKLIERFRSARNDETAAGIKTTSQIIQQIINVRDLIGRVEREHLVNMLHIKQSRGESLTDEEDRYLRENDPDNYP